MPYMCARLSERAHAFCLEAGVFDHENKGEPSTTNIVYRTVKETNREAVAPSSDMDGRKTCLTG